MATKKKQQEKPPEAKQAIPLFYTIVINPLTGQYDARTNASPAGLPTVANALLTEYQRLNQLVIDALGQKEEAKE